LKERLGSNPGQHPEPPADLDEREPLVLETPRHWFRIHRPGRTPLYFGRQGWFRFDSPDGAYGVLYVATDEFGAFIETLGQATGINTVTESALQNAALSRIESSRPLRLIDLVGTGGLARVGADARLIAGDRRIAQRWSAALRGHPSHPDGIYYPPRHDPNRAAAAVFDHAEPLFSSSELGCLDEPRHATLVGAILDTYGFGLIDDKSR
jgi:hypothetical protein